MQRSARARRIAARVLVAIAAVALGYALLRLAQPSHGVPSAASIPSAAVPAATTSPAQPAKPETATVASAKMPEEHRAATPANDPKPGAPRLASKRAVEAAPVAAPLPVDRFPAVAEPPPVPVPAPEPASAPRPAPPSRDRWQLMVDEIAQCGRDGFFSGVICEQKIRLKYCEGYWGQVAQCPSGIPNDHGQ